MVSVRNGKTGARRAPPMFDVCMRAAERKVSAAEIETLREKVAKAKAEVAERKAASAEREAAWAAEIKALREEVAKAKAEVASLREKKEAAIARCDKAEAEVAKAKAEAEVATLRVEAAAEKAKPTPLLRFSLTALTGATVSVRIKLLPDDGDAGEKLYSTAEPEPLAKRCARLEAENESMPGGYKVGEKLYYIGPSFKWSDSDRHVYGEQGEVLGPGTSKNAEGKLRIKFPSIKSADLDYSLERLSRSPPPPLPGGYKLGEKLYYIGSSFAFGEGSNRYVYGEQGEVMGPSKKGDTLNMIFAGNTYEVACQLDELSRSPPPPLPGGYAIGEKLYYLGASIPVDDGDRYVYGEQGEVMGPGDEEGELEIKFPNNKGNIDCTLDELSRSPPPPLPGGYKVGEKLYYTGASLTFESGDRLVHGEQGEVMGPYLVNTGQLEIKFPGIKTNCPVRLQDLSRSPPSDVEDIRALFNPTIGLLRTAFNGWCDVHDRKVITRRAAKAAKAAALAARAAAKLKAEKKAQRKLGLAMKYADADAARPAEEGQSTAAQKKDDYEDLLRHPPMSAHERERDAQRRERARKSRLERAAAAEMEEAKAKAAAARASMAMAAAPVLQPEPTGRRKQAELVHTAFVSEQERKVRAAAGAQKQAEEAAAAAKKREKEKERKKRQKEAKKAAAQAEREQELPAAPTLGAYIDLSGLVD